MVNVSRWVHPVVIVFSVSSACFRGQAGPGRHCFWLGDNSLDPSTLLKRESFCSVHAWFTGLSVALPFVRKHDDICTHISTFTDVRACEVCMTHYSLTLTLIAVSGLNKGLPAIFPFSWYTINKGFLSVISVRKALLLPRRLVNVGSLRND